MEKIILASSSPRRSELLSRAGIPFTVMPSDVDESKVNLTGTPEMKAEYLAYLKASDVARKVESGIVLGADTIVVCDDEIFGKPCDEADALRMLKRLNGREHIVITGVALIDASGKKESVGHETTQVRFSTLKDKEIMAYIKTGEPFGKAGAYAIQERGSLMVESINGCFSNVVGLPIRKLVKMLGDFGIMVLE